MFDAIVPAYNEEGTIAAVVTTLRAARSVNRVLVVDDGSKDRTWNVATNAGAEVLSISPNRGKGNAMLTGLRATSSQLVGFFDADLVGLRPEHVERLASVSQRGYEMTCGLRDYGFFGNPVQLMGPLITGERICSREMLNQVPLSCWSGYAIETAMNTTARRTGARVACVLLPGLGIRNKVSKGGGFWKGMRGHVTMLAEIIRTSQSLKESCGTECARRRTA